MKCCKSYKIIHVVHFYALFLNFIHSGQFLQIWHLCTPKKPCFPDILSVISLPNLAW